MARLRSSTASSRRPSFGFGHSAVLESFGGSRVEAYGAVAVLYGFGVAIKGNLGDGAVGVEFRVPGINADCPVKVRDGFLAATELLIGDSAVLESFGGSRVEAYCAVIVFYCLLVAVEVRLGDTSVEVGIRVFGVEAYLRGQNPRWLLRALRARPSKPPCSNSCRSFLGLRCIARSKSSADSSNCPRENLENPRLW